MAWTQVLEFKCPHGNIAVVKSVHQALESPQAYDDCTIGLEHKGKIIPWWGTTKAEVTPLCLFVFEQEHIRLVVDNEGLVDHYCDAEFTGYLYPRLNADEGQLGVTPHIGFEMAQGAKLKRT